MENSTTAEGPWTITLDYPSYSQFLKYASNRSLRETLHRAYASRASQCSYNNEPLIIELLQKRKAMANLLGYSTFASLSLAKKMATDVSKVEQLQNDLFKRFAPVAEKELQQLQQFANARGQKEPLQPWDIAYWTEQLKLELYEFNDEKIMPYFPFEKVLSGLFELASKLFGITIKDADGSVEVWNNDVRFFKVYDNKNGEHIASFFLDPYSRSGEKNGGAWMNTCVSRCRLNNSSMNGSVRIPVAYLVCNQSVPVNDKPCLMTFRDVETLFHEFGHGLQHMLTTIDYASVSGINGVEWDAVELPSQMMENFCYEQSTLKSISGHVVTGESLPNEIFEKICSARYFMAGTFMLRQLSFGVLDMYLHHNFDTDGSESIFQVQQRIFKEYCRTPQLEDDRFLCSFSHIFAGGYAAGYYR